MKVGSSGISCLYFLLLFLYVIVFLSSSPSASRLEAVGQMLVLVAAAVASRPAEAGQQRGRRGGKPFKFHKRGISKAFALKRKSEEGAFEYSGLGAGKQVLDRTPTNLADPKNDSKSSF